MRPKGPSAELERRRRRAVALVEQGESPTVVARLLGVRPASLHRWRRLAQKPHGLDAKPIPGRPSHLFDYHLRKLERLLRQGAKKHGWPNDLWTADRVARLLRERLGVSFHPEHLRKILKRRLGSTSQKPRRKARQRNDQEVERWKAQQWPRIRRETQERRAHFVFLDESGFQLTPSVRRTLAPRGQTPVLDCWDRRDRLSALSGITRSPVRGRSGLYFQLLPLNQTVPAEEVVTFREEVRRHVRGPLTVVWDRSKSHSKSQLVQEWLRKHPEVVVEDFPGYAPELNPDEWVWSWSKYGRLSNRAAWNAEELWYHIVRALIDLKFQPRMLNACIEKAGLQMAA
jgi:transposase